MNVRYDLLALIAVGAVAVFISVSFMIRGRRRRVRDLWIGPRPGGSYSVEDRGGELPVETELDL